MKTCTETLAAVICTLRDGHESGLFVDSPDPGQRRLWALQEWLRHELPLLLAAEFDHDLELGNIAPAGERERALLRRRLAREVVPEGAGDDEIEAVAWSLGLQVDAKPKAES